MLTDQELGTLIFKTLFDGRGDARKFVMDQTGKKPSPAELDDLLAKAMEVENLLDAVRQHVRVRN